MLLSVFIKVRYSRANVTEIKSIAIERFGNMKNALRIADVNLSQGTVTPTYKPEWVKFSSSLTIEEENVNNKTI